MFNVILHFKNIVFCRFLPTPEGPIRKWDIKVVISCAISKQRQRHGAMFGLVNARFVHTIKHDVNIRYHPRIPFKQLQQSPYRKHHSALHTRVIKIQIQSTFINDHPKCRKILRLHYVILGYPSTRPGLQIVMDKPENFWALGGWLRGLETAPF